MPAGYFFNSSVPQFVRLLGKDQRRASVSSYQGAGGIVASPADVATWDRALYGGRELPRKQQRELESLVSMRTGNPIRRTSNADPQGFGLGVAQATTSATGTFWFYEGTTFGYRFLHLYSSRSGISIVVAANSSSAQDELSPLGLSIYKLVHAGAS